MIVIRSENDKQDVINRIARVKFGENNPVYQCELKEYKKKRSVDQNSLYWLWLKEISKQLFDAGYALKPDTTWHLYFRKHFLGVKNEEVMGKIVTDLISTTTLNTKQFTEYLENIEHYVGSEWELQLPHPEDKYYSAFGFKVAKDKHVS